MLLSAKFHFFFVCSLFIVYFSFFVYIFKLTLASISDINITNLLGTMSCFLCLIWHTYTHIRVCLVFECLISSQQHVTHMRHFHRGKPFRDKIRDNRFRDKKTFEAPVSINSLSRIETSVFEVTGFFDFSPQLFL